MLESGQESSLLESARLRLEEAHAIRKDLADLGIIMTFDSSSGDVHLMTTTSIPKNEGALVFGDYMPRQTLLTYCETALNNTILKKLKNRGRLMLFIGNSSDCLFNT